MNDLLQTAVEAHGGLHRWDELRSVRMLRTVFASDANKQKVPEPILVTIDIAHMSIA